MRWRDEAFVISAKKFGESSRIVTLLTFNYGLYSGLVRSIRKSGALCQQGNLLDVEWKARLEEQLGSFNLEPKKLYSGTIIDDSFKLSALVSACELISKTLHEREPHFEIFESFRNFIVMINEDSVTSEKWLQYYITLELNILRLTGYGLDLSSCAASGGLEELVYISPKTGRAVSRQSGEEYKNRLLKLPPYLRPTSDSTYKEYAENPKEIIDGLLISRYFLEKFFFIPHDARIPDACEQFRQRLLDYYPDR